mmetsp:Transcript_71034/g.205681  ORF Transcript_71034/g.205681 Transcript_71034/m.205681 type:complete len:268 (+) Transcript_71034:1565-2368(+)
MVGQTLGAAASGQRLRDRRGSYRKSESVAPNQFCHYCDASEARGSMPGFSKKTDSVRLALCARRRAAGGSLHPGQRHVDLQALRLFAGVGRLLRDAGLAEDPGGQADDLGSRKARVPQGAAHSARLQGEKANCADAAIHRGRRGLPLLPQQVRLAEHNAQPEAALPVDDQLSRLWPGRLRGLLYTAAGRPGRRHHLSRSNLRWLRMARSRRRRSAKTTTGAFRGIAHRDARSFLTLCAVCCRLSCEEPQKSLLRDSGRLLLQSAFAA